MGSGPIPASERSLETITAERWFTVSDQPMVLGGPASDRTGALIFSDVYGGRILRLTSDRHLSTIATHKGLGNGGVAIHKDGRIFAACIGDLRGNGSIVAMNADGSHFKTIIPPSAGFLPNDLVVDMQGGFYFSDFHDTSVDPAGGVYYVAPDLRTVTPILRHVSEANGIALSPDGKHLWSTDFGRNMLLRIDLERPTSVALIGTAVSYYFTGAAPDSMRTDADGNVYVAMYSQGRVLVLNRNGIPIAQILLPGKSTVAPGSRKSKPTTHP